jgi:hypothetical protein
MFEKIMPIKYDRCDAQQIVRTKFPNGGASYEPETVRYASPGCDREFVLMGPVLGPSLV